MAYNQFPQWGYGGAYAGFSQPMYFTPQPMFLTGGEYMAGPKGRVPVYETSDCVYTKSKEQTNWDMYNDYKSMAKQYNDDPVFTAVARMEADASWQQLTGKTDANHEYYRNWYINHHLG